ncbi:MAG: hypothetical protein ACLTBV_21605 [Enterocloster bolteae]
MKRKIALLLITGICLANTVPCFASPSMKVKLFQVPKKINIPAPPDRGYPAKGCGIQAQGACKPGWRLSVWQRKYYGII